MQDAGLSKLTAATAFVRSSWGERRPVLGIVLGSGLGAFADALTAPHRIPYTQIPFMPDVSISGHAGNLVFGDLVGVHIACLQGRVHLYEGHDVTRVVFGVRLLSEL